MRTSFAVNITILRISCRDTVSIVCVTDGLYIVCVVGRCAVFRGVASLIRRRFRTCDVSAERSRAGADDTLSVLIDSPPLQGGNIFAFLLYWRVETDVLLLLLL